MRRPEKPFTYPCQEICPGCRRRCLPPTQLDGVVLGQQRLGVNVLSLIATLREEGQFGNPPLLLQNGGLQPDDDDDESSAVGGAPVDFGFHA